METPRTALAPSLALLGVPSSSIMRASMASWSRGSRPMSSGAILELTLSTALETPLPPHFFLSSSRSSTASCSPVDAPEGTAARAMVPSSRATSTSTVGLPRESRISRAPTASMLGTAHSVASRLGFLRQAALSGDPSLRRWAAMSAPDPPRPHRRALTQLLLGLGPLLVIGIVLLIVLTLRLAEARAPLAAARESGTAHVVASGQDPDGRGVSVTIDGTPRRTGT